MIELPINKVRAYVVYFYNIGQLILHTVLPRYEVSFWTNENEIVSQNSNQIRITFQH